MQAGKPSIWLSQELRHSRRVCTSHLDAERVRRSASMFRYLLRLADGDPYDPPAFVTVMPTWHADHEFLITHDQRVGGTARGFALGEREPGPPRNEGGGNSRKSDVPGLQCPQ